MRKTIFVLLACQIFGASAALASGFALREASAGAMGTAYAGAAALDGDAGYLFYNPAALAGVKDWDVSASLTGLVLGSSARFGATTAAGTPAGGLADPRGFIGDALVPAVAARYRLTDDLAVGFTFTVPWGEVTDYPATWAGRYYAASTSLTAYNVTAAVSYQLSDELTVAAGAQVQYARSQLTQAIDFGSLGAANHIPGAVPGAQDGLTDLHGHSWGGGYVLGARWQPTPALAFGLSYRSGIQMVLKGSERFTFDAAGIGATIHALTGAFTDSTGRADLPTPAVTTAGATWQVDEQWTLLASAEYTNWSALRQLFIQPDNPLNPQSLTVLNWKDTWFGSLGATYRYDDRWTLRAGTAFDAAAAPPQTLEPRIPDADRYWLSAGVGYRWNDRADVNFAVSHLFTPRSFIDQSVLQPGNAARGSLQGSSESDATLIAVQLVLR
ncbi:MAG: outer membrane protein transport protein [Rhizomicrobium sp.]